MVSFKITNDVTTRKKNPSTLHIFIPTKDLRFGRGIPFKMPVVDATQRILAIHRIPVYKGKGGLTQSQFMPFDADRKSICDTPKQNRYTHVVMAMSRAVMAHFSDKVTINPASNYTRKQPLLFVPYI